MVGDTDEKLDVSSIYFQLDLVITDWFCVHLEAPEQRLPSGQNRYSFQRLTSLKPCNQNCRIIWIKVEGLGSCDVLKTTDDWHTISSNAVRVPAFAPV